MELEDSEETVYAKRYITELKSKTIFTNESPYVMIDNIEVIDLGIFSGKTLGFTLKVPSKNLKVVRTE